MAVQVTVLAINLKMPEMTRQLQARPALCSLLSCCFENKPKSWPVGCHKMTTLQRLGMRELKGDQHLTYKNCFKVNTGADKY